MFHIRQADGVIRTGFNFCVGRGVKSYGVIFYFRGFACDLLYRTDRKPRWRAGWLYDPRIV